MTIRRPYRSLRSIAAITLAALFFLLAIGITLTATGVYRRIAASAEVHFSQRTALSYLLNQLRRGDEENAISMTDFGDGDAIRIGESDGYCTLLYCWNGNLMELYTDSSLSLPPEDGEALLEAQSLSLSYEDHLLRLTVLTADGGSFSAAFCPRSGFEEVGSA